MNLLTNWDSSLAGQKTEAAEKFLIGKWLEKTHHDNQEYNSIPLYSAFQLLRNLKLSIPLILDKTVSRYNVRSIAEELLFRLSRECWLHELYPVEISHLRGKLESLVSQESSNRRKEADSTLKDMAFLLEAFENKVIAQDPFSLQRERLATLSQSEGLDLEVFANVEATVDEFVADLLHSGHARDYLHRWMLKYVIGKSGVDIETSYMRRFLNAPPLGQEHSFVVFILSYLPLSFSTDTLPISRTIPVEFRSWRGYEVAIQRFGIPVENDSAAPGDRNWLIVRNRASDYQAAIDQARDLVGLMFDTKFNNVTFVRTLPGQQLVAQEKDSDGFFVGSFPRSSAYKQESLKNEVFFYEMERQRCNRRAFARLERALNWYHVTLQSNAPLETKLISLWTTVEYLFSMDGEKEPEIVKIRRFLPPYIVLNRCRIQLLEFYHLVRKFQIELPEGTQLVDTADPQKVILAKFLEFCYLITKQRTAFCLKLEEEPLLLKKLSDLASLSPQASEDTTPLRFFETLEQKVRFDIDSIYRTRNRLVHQAEMDMVDLNRIFRRLNCLLVTVLDQVLFRFRFNKHDSLEAFHYAFSTHYEILKNKIGENTATYSDVAEPQLSFLTGKS